MHDRHCFRYRGFSINKIAKKKNPKTKQNKNPYLLKLHSSGAMKLHENIKKVSVDRKERRSKD